MQASSKPVGPPSHRGLGHLPQFVRDKVGFLYRCARDYGEVVPLKLGKPTFLLTGPEDLKHILITNAANYLKTPRLHSSKGRHTLGDNLLTSSGPAHQKRRRLLTPLFHNILSDHFADVIVRHTCAMTSQWKVGDIINISSAMRDLTQGVMIRMLFGDDGKIDLSNLGPAVMKRRAYYAHMLGTLLPLPQYIPSRAKFGYAAAMRRIDGSIRDAITIRRNANEPGPDVISGFIQARHIDGTALDDDQIREEAITFIDAGFETISAALTWAWYLLAQHPQIQHNLHAESSAVLGDRAPKAADVRRLSYTSMVLSEAMRLYPPSWMFVRIPLENDVLPSGTMVTPQTKLYMCPFAAHRNPRYYSEPEVFDPMRFSEDATATRPRLAYFPFGAGAHACIGEMFARFEGTIVLATLSRMFEFSLMPNQNVSLHAGIVLKPRHGVRMRLRPPTSSNPDRP